VRPVAGTEEGDREPAFDGIGHPAVVLR